MAEIRSESLQFDINSISDVGTEEEEIDVEDIENSTNSCNEITSISKDENACLLVRICLQNISNKVYINDIHIIHFFSCDLLYI